MPTKVLLIAVVALLALTVLSPLAGRSADQDCPAPAPTAMNGGAYFEASQLATPTPASEPAPLYPHV